MYSISDEFELVLPSAGGLDVHTIDIGTSSDGIYVVHTVPN
jgi:hypothetical protein